jgi:hypothetical protein
VDTVDVGVPLLSMHAPMEIASKIDILMMHRPPKLSTAQNNKQPKKALPDLGRAFLYGVLRDRRE